MNLIKQAFIEWYQAYKHQFTTIHRHWGKKIAINVANSKFSQTGVQHYVLINGQGDYEVLSQPSIEKRLMVLKENGELPRTVTMMDIRKQAVYVTT